MGTSQPICRTKVGALRSEPGKRGKRETAASWQDHSWRIVEQTGKKEKNGDTSACWQDQSWRTMEQTGKKAKQGHVSLLAGSELAH